MPYDSPLVVAVAHGGPLDVRGYRGGTFVGYTTFGRLSVQNGGGVAFLQSNRGAIVVNDSSFDRIRTRSLTGNITFERCVVRQIETTSVGGSVVFDGGQFPAGSRALRIVPGRRRDRVGERSRTLRTHRERARVLELPRSHVHQRQ